MSAGPGLYVLDASVGVKWFKDEPGHEVARGLFDSALSGGIELAVPVHFAHEVLAVVRRQFGASAIPEAFGRLVACGVAVIPLSEEVVVEAARQCDVLGCSFYDALAPACASILHATLVSADARAHGGYPGVHLVE